MAAAFCELVIKTKLQSILEKHFVFAKSWS